MNSKHSFFKVWAGLLILALMLSLAPYQAQPAYAVSPNIVISQVYGGGGNSGATLTNDFVELFNRGNSTVDITGWSVQYASSSGSTWQVTGLSGSVQPGQYYLVQEAAGSGGTTSLPTPDATGTIAMSGTNGKVAVVNTTTALSGSTPSDPSIVDVVGYGTANFYEGSGAAPALTNTTAALRAGNGCTDTDDNASDFSADSPAPRNTASPSNSCGGSLATELFFSEYIEGTSNNKALEIYNGTGSPVDLAAGGYNVQMFFNGSATAGLTINLIGTVANGDVFVLAQSSADAAILAQADQTNGSGWFNGNDAVALFKGTTAIDVIGQIGFNPGTEWGSGLTSTADNTLRRKADICAGDPDGTDPFDPAVEWDGYATNTFDGLGSHTANCGGGPVSTNPSGTGAADPDLVSIGQSSLLTVAVTPGENPPSTGLAVSCDLSGIGGSATQTFYDDGSNGDATAGDGTFSYTATSTTATSVSANDFPCTITDAEARTGTASISLDVIVPIGTVNGPVGDTDDGTAHRSPFAPPSGNGSGKTVFVQGVIYEKTLQATSFGGTYKGFYIQNTTETADGDPNTSDGLFVFMSTFNDLIGGYVPAVGDEVVISGIVSEYYNMTELSNARALQVVHSGLDIEAEVPPVEANPPVSLADANRYWERLQGMRLQVPQNTIVLNGRNVFSPADAEVWVARSDSTIAGRADPYTRRAFRDAHPLDDNYDPNNWDGNGYRILLGSLGIKATENNGDALIAPARTFDIVTNAPVGGLNYTFNKYRIEITDQPELSVGPDPTANNPPTTFNRSADFSIVDYNLENLYDYRDNPFSGCDFTNVPNNSNGSNPKCDNSGTPFYASVTPASDGTYNYVPASEAAYQARISDIANQIINDLHSPDILMVQEVENQDICKITDGAMECGATNNADGQPDDLQDLALQIASLGGPTYAAAFDRDSSDLRGIVPAFMYRTDRVQLLPAAGDPLLGGLPAINYAGAAASFNSDVSNPKTLNATSLADTTGCETTMVFPRAPDIGLFRIYRVGIGLGSYRDVYVINNHFKSGPDSCVGPRTEQAKYNAAIVAFLEGEKPDANIVVGGDLNVYPRPDDPFAPLGQPGSSDQLGALYNPSIGLKNLWEVLLDQEPQAAYSYVYVGMAQTLDQMFVNGPMLSDLEQFRSAHINSDFPADYPGDVARGTSDHDPQVGAFNFQAVTIDELVNLVQEYTDMGQITGNNTTQILLNRLEKARRFQEAGQQDAYMDQLQAFIDQIYDFTPEFITQEAADALVNVTTLLQSQP